MNQWSLEQRVLRLEREVERLRRALDGGGGEVETPGSERGTRPEGGRVGVAPPDALVADGRAEPAPQDVSKGAEAPHGAAPQSGSRPVASEARASAAIADVQDSGEALHWAASQIRSRSGAPGAGAPRFADTTLERRIGGQVFAVAGALIVVIGLALAVKVAIDQGWFRLFPPGVRCFAIAGVGVGLLGTAEALRTRVRAIAVAGLNGAGIGALFVAAYAAYGVFHLVGAPVAFALMTAAAGAGMAAALRHGFLSSAVLSLVGAYLVPILLARADTSPYVMPVYLLLLSAVALSLAAWRGRPFGRVRDVAWIGTGLLGFLWTLAEAESVPGAVLTFWACAWAMHQAELLVTAARGQLWQRGEGLPDAWPSPSKHGSDHGTHGEWPSPSEHGPDRSTRGPWRRRIEPIVLAVATTAGAVAIGAVVLEHRTELAHWLAPAAVFAATSVLAIVFGGHIRVLRDKPRTDLETLAAAHAAQAGALLVVTIALALGGWVEVSAWLAMGVGAIVAGRWTGARSLDGYGLVLLAIASARLALYDIASGPASVAWAVGAGVVIAPWTVLVLGAGAAWMLAAALMLVVVRDEDDRIAIAPRSRMGVACATMATAMWMLAPAHPDSAAAAICLVWLGLSFALLGASRIWRALHLDVLGAVVGAGAILPWAIASDFPAWLRDTGAPGTNRGLWLGAAIVIVLLAHAWSARKRWPWGEFGSPWPLLAALGAGVALGATSIEIARSAGIVADDVTAQRAAVSLWWGLWGVAMVVGGFWRRTAPVRYVGLALMTIAAAKAVLLDLAGVPPLWRVGSFVGLGALMLGVAVLYGRVSSSLEEDEG